MLALPFSQLVPVFTLLESLHLPAVSKLLRRVGLRPTVEDATATSDGDSLWALMQRKSQAHAGFLVEALVEAIPQCALQVSAVVVAGDGVGAHHLLDPRSLSVICSKGWLAAYSLHRLSFAFNVAAIAADVVGPLLPLRRRAVTLGDAARCRPLPHARIVWLVLGGAGACLGFAGGGAAVGFSVADDHLKTRRLRGPGGFAVESVAFNLYSAAARVAAVRAAVRRAARHAPPLAAAHPRVQVSLRARFRPPYKPLFAFLHTPAADAADDEEDGDGEAADVGSRGRDGRLRAANSLIGHAHSQKGALVSPQRSAGADRRRARGGGARVGAVARPARPTRFGGGGGGGEGDADADAAAPAEAGSPVTRWADDATVAAR